MHPLFLSEAQFWLFTSFLITKPRSTWSSLNRRYERICWRIDMPKQTNELLFSSGLAVATLFALSIEVRGNHKENKETRFFAGGKQVLLIFLYPF
jgi:hypothetical protein